MQNGDEYAGYKWLSEAYDVAPVQPFPPMATPNCSRQDGVIMRGLR